MPHIQGLFQHTALLKVLAANIRDGEALDLHPDNHFQLVARAVRAGLDTRKGPGNADAEDYLIEFEELCFGPLPGRPGTAYLLCSRSKVAPPKDRPDWYSVVVTVTHWKKYLSTAAVHQLARAAGVPLPFVPMGGIEDVALYRILTKLRRGEFTPKSDFSLGFPLVWITPRPEFEQRITSRTDRADAARDYLGLIHREENEHLIALHIPASAVELVDSARPIFSDAGRHRRFIVQSDNVPPLFTKAWGQTLDLEQFEANQSRGSGGAERVCRRIKIDYLGGVKLPFEYLGRVQTTRGRSTATDADFATCQVARGRQGFAQIVQQI